MHRYTFAKSLKHKARCVRPGPSTAQTATTNKTTVDGSRFRQPMDILSTLGCYPRDQPTRQVTSPSGSCPIRPLSWRHILPRNVMHGDTSGTFALHLASTASISNRLQPHRGCQSNAKKRSASPRRLAWQLRQKSASLANVPTSSFTDHDFMPAMVVEPPVTQTQAFLVGHKPGVARASCSTAGS